MLDEQCKRADEIKIMLCTDWQATKEPYNI
jgi:hypothetical protein